MPVNPIDAVNPTRAQQQSQQQGVLGKDDFLKLLVGQMQNQDPLNPSDPTQQMGEMTQFSILEQITNLGQSQQAQASNEYDQEAVALIGRTVTYVRADGSNATGVVGSVTFTGNGPTLTVGSDTGIAPVTVTEVR
ncbi:MAG TPA: flagellar hook capping FlgD N-terminal domain-containing protein [Conexibacter sp.]|nr:flagellar hook capping FlgD N-terminal domain-containing protein [Conexibacter sp.]